MNKITEVCDKVLEAVGGFCFILFAFYIGCVVVSTVMDKLYIAWKLYNGSYY